MLIFQEKMRSREQSGNLKKWKRKGFRLKRLNYPRRNKRSCVQLSYQKMNLEKRHKNSLVKRK